MTFAVLATAFAVVACVPYGTSHSSHYEPVRHETVYHGKGHLKGHNSVPVHQPQIHFPEPVHYSRPVHHQSYGKNFIL